MCITDLGSMEKVTVLVWKAFEKKENGKLQFLCQSSGNRPLKRRKRLKAQHAEFGFQAFAKRPNVRLFRETWPEAVFVRVLFRKARKGVIEKMDSNSNGLAGWDAREMYVP